MEKMKKKWSVARRRQRSPSPPTRLQGARGQWWMDVLLLLLLLPERRAWWPQNSRTTDDGGASSASDAGTTTGGGGEEAARGVSDGRSSGRGMGSQAFVRSLVLSARQDLVVVVVRLFGVVVIRCRIVDCLIAADPLV